MKKKNNKKQPQTIKNRVTKEQPRLKGKTNSSKNNNYKPRIIKKNYLEP